MVSIFTGLGSGFERGSLAQLGTAGLLGSGALGRSGEQLSLNAATGNLLISQRDEFLTGAGPDSAIARTYNSLGNFSDDNGDNWRQSTDRRVHGLTGTLNAAGSTISRTSGDGSDIVYSWNGSAYVATDGSGAYDKLTSAGGVWTWTDGDNQSTETYQAYGTDNWRITRAANARGNALTFSYVGALLDKVTTANGEYEQYSWSGNNITQIVTGYTDLATSTATTLTRTRYGYDGSNRLTTVTVDLSPEDNSVADGKAYVTTYTYDGTSKRVATITETDGSQLTIGYDGSGRVTGLTQTVATGVTRLTSIAYNSGYTIITDPLGQVTRLDYDASDQLTKITSPPAYSGAAAQVQQFAYDASGNVTDVTDALGNITHYTYDASGNVLTVTDPLGNVTTRTYGAKNELLTETVTGSDNGSAAASHTTRYVYDGFDQLTYTISAEGHVTRNFYSPNSTVYQTWQYTAQFYDVSGLAATTALSATDLSTWESEIADKSTVAVTYNYFDVRGNVTETRSYGIANTAGNGLPDQGYTATQYTYDQAGQLLKRTTTSLNSETFVYDGMGRITASTDLNGATTHIAFNDASMQTVVTLANGLVKTTTYNKAGEVISQTDSLDTTGGTTSGNLLPTLSSPYWTNGTAAGTLGGASAYSYTDGGGGGVTMGSNYVTSNAGDTVTFDIYVKGSGGNSSAAFALTGNGAVLSASIISGQGTISGSGWYDVTGLSTTTTDDGTQTHIRIVRQANATGVNWIYVLAGLSTDTSRGGKTIVLAAPSVVRLQVPTPQYQYDADGQLRIHTDRTGRQSYFVYDHAGRKVADVDQDGHMVEYQYDADNRVVGTVRYAGVVSSSNITTYLQNPASSFELATIRPSANADDLWSWKVYDADNRVVEAIDGAGDVTTYQYDGSGQLITTTSYANKLTSTELAWLKAAPAGLAFNRLNNSQLDGTSGWGIGYNPNNIVNGGSPYAGVSNGKSYIKIDFTATAANQVASIATYEPWFPVAAGERFAVQAGVEGQGAIGTLKLTVWWHDVNGNSIGSSDIGTLSGTQAFNTKISGFATAPAGAVVGRIELYMDSSAAGSGSFDFTEPMVSQATATQTTVPTFTPLPAADGAHDSVSRIFYDKDGRVVGTLDGEGYLTQTVYDAAGRKIQQTVFANPSAPSLTTNGTITQIVHSTTPSTADRTSRWVYDGQGLLRYQIDALGHVVEYVYPQQVNWQWTAFGDVRQTIQYATAIGTLSSYDFATVKAAVASQASDTNNRNSWAVYDAANRLLYAIDASGAVKGYGYDAYGRVIRTTQYATIRATGSLPNQSIMDSWATANANANDRITRNFYDTRGELEYTVDAEGFITRFDYDGESRLVATVRYDAAIGTTTFAAFTDATTLATIAALATGAATTNSTNYDNEGRVASTTDGQGFVTRYAYNANGTLDSTYDAFGTADQAQTKFTYDGAGRVLTRTDAYGATEARVTAYGYDGLGDATSITDPNGNTTTSTYDHLGRKLTQTDPLGGVTTWQYDAFGDVVKVTDARSNASYAYYDNLGRVTLSYDAEQYGTQSTYTVFGELASVKRWYTRANNAGSVSITTQPTFATDANDATTSFSYDRLGRVLTTTDAIGNTESYTLTAFGQRATATTAVGTITTNSYDRRGLLKTQVVDSGSGGKAITSSFTYDAMGHQLQATDPTNHTNSVAYDRDGRVVTSTDALSHATTYTYDGRGNIVAVQDALGNVTRRAYDKLDRLIYTVDALGNVTQNTYDANGQVISTRAYATPISLSGLATAASVADIAARVTASGTADELTRSVYDGDGRLRYTVDPGNFLTEFDYDATGNVIRRVAYTTAITSAATYTIAAIQAQISAMSGSDLANARITRNVYSAEGKLTYTIDALGDVTAYTHDAFGNTVKQQQVAVLYTATGDPTDAAMATWLGTNGSAANDHITRAIYDQDGRLRFAVDAERYVTQYTYDAVGNVRLTTRYADRFDGHTNASITYSAFTDSTTLAQALSYVAVTPTAAAAVSERQYDTAGRLYQSIDPAGTITRFTLDQLGRAVTTEVAYGTADASVTTQTFDAVGRVSSVTRAYGQLEATTTSYRYDALGRMTGKLEGNGSAVLAALGTSPTQAQIDSVYTNYGTTYGYDVNGNVTTETVALNVDTNGNTVFAVTTNSYDAFGNLVKVIDPRNNAGYFYYDALDRLALQVDPNGYATETTYLIGSTAVATVTHYAAVAGGAYSATVRPTITTDPNDETTTFSYDKLNRLTGTTDAAGFTESYTFDAFGNRLSVTNKLTGITYYTYDARGLMLTEKLPEQSVATNGTVNASFVINAYSYDSRGNRVSMIEAQGLPEQRTTRYAYDALDRLITQTGDAVATLAQGTAAPVTSYQYDRNGNVILTTDPNGARTFSYYDDLNRKIAEINAVGTFTAWTYDSNGNVLTQKTYGTAQSLPATAGGTPPAITNPSVFREIDYSYDRDNRLLATSTPGVTTGKWNGSSYVTTTGTLVTGRNVYDASGNIVQTIDGNGVSTYTYYDKAGRKIGQVDGAGYLTAYELDQDGNVTKETRYATAVTGASTSSTFTSLVTAAGSTANDRITKFTYDKMGRRLTEKRLNVASATISLTGVMTTATADAIITYTYNGLGEVASKTEATLDVTSTVKDVTNYSYDLAGRLTTTLGATITDSTGATVRLETDNSYDGLNNLTRTRVGTQTLSSANDRITTYVYGAGGRLMATTNAGVNAAETQLATYYVYDLAGHVVQQNQIRNVSDAASNTVDLRTTISYDALGRATSQQSAYLATTLPTQFDFSQNLIVNGSFETIGTVTSYPSWGYMTSTLPGWTKNNSGVLDVQTSGASTHITPTDGNYTIDTDGEGGAGSNIDISQTVSGLTAGQAVQLSFDHIDPVGNNPIQVYWNGTLVATVTDYGTVLMTSTYNLTAIAGSNVLRLVGTGPTENAGAALDNVRLYAALPSPVSSGWVNGDSQGVVYDAYGEVTAQSVNGTLTTKAAYDGTGHVVQSNSGDGTWKTYVNDGNGNATLTIQSTGTTDLSTQTVAQALALATNNGANTVGAAAGNGVVVTIGVFDGRNQQTQTLMPFRDSVMDSNNVVSSYTVGQYGINTAQSYNAFGEVASQTDARGNTTSFVYNTMGRVTAQISPQVQVTDQTGAVSTATPTQYSYFDLSGRLVATRDANANLTTRVLLAGTGYGGADPLSLAEFHPDGGVVRTAYDVFGDTTKLTDALGYITNNKFDHMGNLIEVDHPTRTLNSDGTAGDGSQLIDYYTYDGLSERVGHSNNVVTNPIYGAPVGTYHDPGYPTYSGYTTYSSPVIGYTPVTETTAYDSEGRIVSTTDFGGHTTQYLYQWNGTQATTGLATYGGWTKIVTYADSAVTSKDTTDAFGHEVARTDLGGNVYSFAFNKAGQLITQASVTAAGIAAENIAYTYYNTGKIHTITDNSTRSSYYYSASVTSTFSYDRSGNRLTTSYISTSNYQYSYYGYYYSTPITTTLENSTATYDAMNRVVTISDPGDSANLRPSFNQTRTYDANGNVRSNITTHQNIDSGQNLTAATTDAYWFAYDSMNRFVVTEGTLSGTAGASGTTIIGGTTGTVITYDANSQRKTAISYAGYQYSKEIYAYTADGYLSTVGIGTSWDGITFTSPVIRSVDTRDALGRVTVHNEYDASGATYNAGSHSWSGNVVYSRSAAYNNLGQVTSDMVSAVQGGDNNVTSTSYLYAQHTYNASTGLWSDTAGTYLGGNVLSQLSTNSKNNSYQYGVNTKNSYIWYDSAQQKLITATYSGNQSGTTTTTFSYDGNGHVAQATRTGQNANTISYTTDASGQIMARKQQTTGSSSSPAEYYFYLNNVTIGEISNNGSENLNYAASITQQTSTPGSGPFANGATSGTPYANFDLSYQAMNPTAMAEGGAASNYTVQAGDTLSTVAQNVYGDSSLWYLIAQANGLTSNSALTAGQTLSVPAKVSNDHNNATTFKPYNPNAALGDVQPGAPIPPKAKNCGILGAILMVVIAAVVSFILPPVGIAVGNAIGGVFSTAIGLGVQAVLVDAVSQGIDVAVGLKDKFSFKEVGLTFASAVVSFGVGKLIPNGAIGGSALLTNIVRGAVSEGITQGIGVATGLQDHFDWASVAAAGVTEGFIGSVHTGSGAGGYAARFAAREVINASTHSLINGTDFGDNLISALPSSIGATLNEVISDRVKQKAAEKSRDQATGGVPLNLDLNTINGDLVAKMQLEARYGRMEDAAAVVADERAKLGPAPQKRSGGQIYDSAEIVVTGPPIKRHVTATTTSYGSWSGVYDPDLSQRASLAAHAANHDSAMDFAIHALNPNNIRATAAAIADQDLDALERSHRSLLAIRDQLDGDARGRVQQLIDTIDPYFNAREKQFQTFYNQQLWDAGKFLATTLVVGTAVVATGGTAGVLLAGGTLSVSGVVGTSVAIDYAQAGIRDLYSGWTTGRLGDAHTLGGYVLDQVAPGYGETIYGVANLAHGVYAVSRELPALLGNAPYVFDSAAPRVFDLGLNSPRLTLSAPTLDGFGGATGVAAEEIGGSALPRLNPSEIRFTQDTVSPNFSNGGTITDAVKSLRNGEISVDDFPAIRVVNHDGELWSLDNRRLATFSAAQVDSVPVRILDMSDSAVTSEFLKKFNPINGGRNVVVVPSAGRAAARSVLRQHGM